MVEAGLKTLHLPLMRRRQRTERSLSLLVFLSSEVGGQQFTSVTPLHQNCTTALFREGAVGLVGSVLTLPVWHQSSCHANK